jgi:hypothetical protein
MGTPPTDQNTPHLFGGKAVQAQIYDYIYESCLHSAAENWIRINRSKSIGTLLPFAKEETV